ncbi:MAG: DMT family transporter [Acidimicrobiaceae bacterium]|nr:DMT family transporter [Acidimicrobiaceae bacterium]
MIKVKPLLLLVLTGAIFGSSYAVVKSVVGPIGPVGLAVSRTAIASSILAVLSKVQNTPKLSVPLRRVVFLGILSATLPYSLLSLCAELTNAGTASVINSTVPAFTLILSVLLKRERLTARSVIGLLIGLAAIALVAEQRQLQMNGPFWIGAGAGLIGSASFAYSGIYAKRFFSQTPAIRIALSQQIVAFLTLLPLLFLFPAKGPLSFGLIPNVVILGVIGTALAYIIFFWLLSNVGAITSSYVTYLVPMFGIFWGWLLLSEPISSMSGIGLLGVLIGLWLLLTPSNAKRVSTAS